MRTSKTPSGGELRMP